MHRWVQQSGLELTPNTKAADPDSPELTIPVAVVDVDRDNSVHTITLGATNTLPLQNDPIVHAALTSVTIAVDGSFTKAQIRTPDNTWTRQTSGRCGFIVLTPWLLEHWQSLMQTENNSDLCDKLLQAPQGANFFRLAEMSQNSAHFSLQPELWAAMMAQSSVPANVKLHLITDNMTSKLAFTESAHKPNRSETRVARRAHIARESDFRKHHPDTCRATATHQHSHTKEHSLSACLNRCIDVLLSYAPPALNTPLPSLTHLEHSQGQLLTKNGQHEIGDRRRCLERELQLQIREEMLESPSQGAVWRTDPQQCEEVRNLADEMGKKKHLLPSLLAACWAENLADFFSFAGADIGPCRRCGQAEGATAAHLMVGGESEALRLQSLKPALIRAFRSGAPNTEHTVTDNEIFAQLTHIPDAGPMKQGPAELDPQSLYRHPDTGKLRGVCPKCQKDLTYSAPNGRLFAHECADRKQTQTGASSSTRPARIPNAAPATPPAAQPPANPKADCPRCGKSFTVTLSGALHRHNCIPQPRPVIFQRPVEQPPGSQEERQPPSAEANAAATAALGLHIHPKRIAMHKREQNAQIIAVYTGILSVPAAAFLKTHIPNPKARGSALKKIRLAFLTFTYEAWIENKTHLRDNMLSKSRSFLRRRAWRSMPNPEKKRRRIHPADEAAWLIQPLDETAWAAFVELNPNLRTILPLYRTPELLQRLQASIRGSDAEARKKVYLLLLQDSLVAFLTQRASEHNADDTDSCSDSDDNHDEDEYEDTDDDQDQVDNQAQATGQDPRPGPPQQDPGPEAPPQPSRKRTSRSPTDAN